MESAVVRETETPARPRNQGEGSEHESRLLEKASPSGPGAISISVVRAAKKGGIAERDPGSRGLGEWLGEPDDERLSQPPRGHVYPLLIMHLAIAQVTVSLTSLGAVKRTFALLAQYWALPTPSFSSIRRWVLRVGLYELQREREYRTDWIYILDLTIELGRAKCLVILGIPRERWEPIVQAGNRGLVHSDMTVLTLEILQSSTGVVIEQALRRLSERVGVPVQILSDHGSDVKKGIERYLDDHPQVHYTYDVTHWLACQLKAELATDERYQAFVQQCHRCRAQLQQTELAGLMPPSQRTKARYFNVERLVNWGQQLGRYQQANDFSQLSPAFTLDAQALESLAPCLPADIHTQLTSLQGHTYANQDAFSQALRQHLGAADFEAQAALLYEASGVGRRRFFQKLGWLQDYQADLDSYAQMVALTQRLERQLKQHGIHHQALSHFIDSTPDQPLSPRLQAFAEKIHNYLVAEGAHIPAEQPLLATSDIIESIFGKYKLFSAKSCLKEIGPMILTLPLCTVQLTTTLVQNAMESVRGIDVDQWLHETLGPSSLAKRKLMFQSTSQDTEVA